MLNRFKCDIAAVVSSRLIVRLHLLGGKHGVVTCAGHVWLRGAVCGVVVLMFVCVWRGFDLKAAGSCCPLTVK